MGELRRIDFRAAVRLLEDAVNAEEREKAELRMRAARAEAMLDRIFKARDTDDLYSQVERAEEELGRVRAGA